MWRIVQTMKFIFIHLSAAFCHFLLDHYVLLSTRFQKIPSLYVLSLMWEISVLLTQNNRWNYCFVYFNIFTFWICRKTNDSELSGSASDRATNSLIHLNMSRCKTDGAELNFILNRPYQHSSHGHRSLQLSCAERCKPDGRKFRTTICNFVFCLSRLCCTALSIFGDRTAKATS